MKKLFAVFLCLVLFALCACEAPAEPKATTIATTIAETADPADSDARYTDYAAFLIDEENRKLYFTGKTRQGDWEEIYAPEDTDASLVCVYRDRLYFYDWLGLAYLDTSEEKPRRVSWIDFSNPGKGYDRVRFSQFALLGDTLYYDWGSRPGGGIFALPMSASSFDEAEEIVPNADFNWQADAQRGVIYYQTHGSSRTDLNVYNLIAKEDKILIGGILSGSTNSFSANSDGTVLWLKDKGREYEIYLYRIEGRENTLIFHTTNENLSGGLWDKAEYHEGKVYYRDKNTLYRYDNSTVTALYTLKNPYQDGRYPYMYGFHHISDEILYISIQGGQDVYLIDDQEAPAPVFLLRLKDGSALECDVSEWSVYMLSKNPAAFVA